MKISLDELLARIPGTPSVQWPDGERYAEGMRHGSMSMGLYAPVGRDPQQPHAQDEIYVIHRGRGVLFIDDRRYDAAPGDAFFVAAGTTHRFADFSDDFATWVVFWGPDGGETPDPS